MQGPKIIYEDKNFLAVDKPAGMIVYFSSGAKKQEGEISLVDWLLKKYPEIKNVGDEQVGGQSNLEIRPGIVHRLDRGTSGVILVARNQKYFEYLKSLFRERKIKKTYWALVRGRVEPKSGIIEKSISTKRGDIKKTIWKGEKEKEAITEYRVKKYLGDNTLLEVFPKTGRTHQIRVHLASIGYPVFGDTFYGKEQRVLNHPPAGGTADRARRKADNSHYTLSPEPRLMLHAFSLEFSAADGRRIRLEDEPPPDFKI